MWPFERKKVEPEFLANIEKLFKKASTVVTTRDVGRNLVELRFLDLPDSPAVKLFERDFSKAEWRVIDAYATAYDAKRCELRRTELMQQLQAICSAIKDE